MPEPVDEPAFARVARTVVPGGSLRRAWRLAGGISAQMTVLEIERDDGRVTRLVVRRHGEADLEQNPTIAADEFRLLQALYAAGLAVPAPVDLELSRKILPTPYLVLEYVDGAPENAPADGDERLRQMAAQLAGIHRLDWSALGLAFLPDHEQALAARLRARPAQIDEALEEGRIRSALEAVWPLPRRNPPVLLHGDYWPGNLLWRDGRLVAVIDWEDAAVGDPLADLGNSRMEILWALGAEAMQRFTDLYASLARVDLTHLPYWDLCAALRPAGRLAEWAADAAEEQRMREGHQLFVAQAFARIAGRSCALPGGGGA